MTQRASGVTEGSDVATGAPEHDAIPRAASRRRRAAPFPDTGACPARRDSPPDRGGLPWRQTRPTAAAAIRSSPRAVPHLPDPGLVAVTSDCPSQDSETAREGGLAPPTPGGGRPSSSVPGGPALASRAGSRSGGPPHRAAAGRARRPRHVRPAASDVAHGHDVPVAAGEGGGRQPPRPRESGQATDPQS